MNKKDLKELVQKVFKNHLNEQKFKKVDESQITDLLRKNKGITDAQRILSQWVSIAKRASAGNLEDRQIDDMIDDVQSAIKLISHL